MDRRELNRMFDGLNPNPGRERELLDGLLQDEKRRKTPMKRWRQVVLAAAACLALMGTAAAAHYVGVSIAENKENGFFEFSGGMTYYPADQLSDEVKAFVAEYAGGYAVMKAFPSWEEMEDFLGVELADSPLLDASPAQNFHKTIDNGEERVSGRFILTAYQGLAQFIADGCYELDGCSINVQAFLFTDRQEESQDLNNVFYGLGDFSGGTDVSWEACTTPGGRQAQAIEIDHSYASGLWDTCIGAVSLNGIPILVRVSARENMANSYQVLMRVLDSFQ